MDIGVQPNPPENARQLVLLLALEHQLDVRRGSKNNCLILEGHGCVAVLTFRGGPFWSKATWWGLMPKPVKRTLDSLYPAWVEERLPTEHVAPDIIAEYRAHLTLCVSELLHKLREDVGPDVAQLDDEQKLALAQALYV